MSAASGAFRERNNGMNEFAARIERDFPLRRREKEKMEFRTWLVHTFKELGYAPRLESGESALAAGGSVTNVVVGDIDKAKIVLAAHYDTGVREILPPLICPTRPLTFLLYQALFPLLLVAGSFLLSLAVTFPLNLPGMMLPLFLLLLAVALFYPKYGPDEKNNRNANTSGVVTLLEVAKTLTPRYRSEVCFLFLDGGTQTGKGAKRLRRAYPRLKEKPVFVVDCVGEGDELLVLGRRPARRHQWEFRQRRKEDLLFEDGRADHFPVGQQSFPAQHSCVRLQEGRGLRPLHSAARHGEHRRGEHCPPARRSLQAHYELPAAKGLTSAGLFGTIIAFTAMKRRSKQEFPAKRAFGRWKKEGERAQIHRGAGARTKLLPVGAPRERPLSRGSVSALREAAFAKRRRTRGGTASDARPLSERTEGVFCYPEAPGNVRKSNENEHRRN